MKRQSRRKSGLDVSRIPASERIRPAVVTFAPHPRVPDEVLQEELSGAAATADLWALFTVREDGAAEVMLLSSTGSAVLDEYGLSAAKTWRFHPATKGGQPITSYLRLHIEFSLV